MEHDAVCGAEYVRWDGVESVCQLEPAHFGDHYWASDDGSRWTWWSGKDARPAS